MAMQPERAYIISHTHWDREWTQSFQVIRKKLVDVMDDLLENLEADNEYRYFHLDGQTILLEDYLEIRPENENRLKRLICEGRLIIGPWYTMPDEALVSAESLVRNIIKGHQIAEKYGVSPMKVGYIIDVFGHNSQLPQIFEGFGIKSAVLFRGLGDFMESAFEWEAPDGSRILGLKLDENRAYADFYFAIRWPFYGRPYEKDELKERFKKHLEYMGARAASGLILMMDGVDNIDMEKQLPWILEVLRENTEGVEIIHSTMARYIEDIKPELKGLKCFKGELREPGKSGINNLVMANVLSSRVHIKQYNSNCQNLLEGWVEPWSAFSDITGKKYPYAFIQKAWDYLLKNHAHDSICGCSNTQVHQDMIYRFDQCREIGECILEDSLKYVISDINTLPMVGEMTVTLFNSNQCEYKGIVTVELESEAISELPLDFKIFDMDGEEVSYQFISMKKRQIIDILQKSDIPAQKTVDIYRVSFHAVIPACGYKCYSYAHYEVPDIKRGEYCALVENHLQRYSGTQIVSYNVMENQYLSVKVNNNGTIDILDKEISHLYKELLIFEDEGDNGDGWNYKSPIENERISSCGRQSNVSIVHDGLCTTTLRSRTSLLLPVETDDDFLSRKQEYKEVDIVTDLTLAAGEKKITCKTVTNNTVRDHRLKLLFPVGLNTNCYYTSTAFDFVQRDVKKKNYCNYKETAQNVVPNHGIIAIDNGNYGIAVYNKGLYEVEVRDDQKRTVALTLLRGTRNEVGNIYHDGGQILDKLTFEYGIECYKRDMDFPGALFKNYRTFSNGIRYLCTGRQAGNLPLQYSFVKIASNSVIISAIKRAESYKSGYLIRLFNPWTSTEHIRVSFGRSFNKVIQVNLNEEVIRDLEFNENYFDVEIGVKKIESFIILL